MASLNSMRSGKPPFVLETAKPPSAETVQEKPSVERKTWAPYRFTVVAHKKF